MVASVSLIQNISWDETWKKDVYEFFNTVSFLRWQSERRKKEIERWKSQN